MHSLTFLQPDGVARAVAAAPGQSLMACAVAANVQGMEGECGGALSCGTCHVYLDGAALAALPPPSDDELQMLDFVAAERRAGSRLGCQVLAEAAPAGTVVVLPESQR